MMPNRCEIQADDLADMREQAAMAVRTLLASPGPEDWRSWVLHVSDDLGEEILTLPFSSVIGRLH
jgi:hypothetical protein